MDTQSDSTKPEYAAPILDDVVLESDSATRPGVIWMRIKAHDDHKISHISISLHNFQIFMIIFHFFLDPAHLKVVNVTWLKYGLSKRGLE